MITERLKIRKFTNDDLTELYNLLSDKDVMEIEGEVPDKIISVLSLLFFLLLLHLQQSVFP